MIQRGAPFVVACAGRHDIVLARRCQRRRSARVSSHGVGNQSAGEAVMHRRRAISGTASPDLPYGLGRGRSWRAAYYSWRRAKLLGDEQTM